MSEPFTEDLISGYADDELDAPTRAEVETAISETPALVEVLVEVVEARDAVRSLPMVDLPPGVLDTIMANVAVADETAADGAGDVAAGTTVAASGVAVGDAVAAAAEPAPVADLERVRRRRRVRVQRWLAGSAAAVVLVGVLVASPQPKQVTPALGRLVDNHTARASDDSDPLSQLATLAVAAPMALFR